jgi:Fuc2NAc and GlcNAc transferase
MSAELVLIAIAAFVLSMVLTGVVLRFAVSRGLLDVPNARSSHSTVTPRGGGLAIVSATTVATIVLAYLGRLPEGLSLAVIGGGSVVAAIGFMDDRRPVPARTRLAVHVVAAVWAVICIGAPTRLQFGQHTAYLGWGGPMLAVLGITWTLNLFNFMDGIDGIAASEAVFVASAGAILALFCGGSAGVTAVALVLGAACVGFLLWNWPPAKIFMGDVGSGYLGYVIGVMGLASVRERPNSLWPWLILGGVFFVDSTLTLIRRSVRGDRVYEAHRSHAYQWLARRWKSHKPVTITATVINLVWLLPCAWFAARNPSLAVWATLVALIPLTIVMLVVGAGRREYA